MTRTPTLLFVAIALTAPRGVAAQCAIDRIESGVRAYRDLDLDNAKGVLRDAVAANGRAASACAAEDARALMYLGASEWLLQMPDSAKGAFRRAVIEAPRFRPDDFEFPPEITEAFEDVRRATPSVAVSVAEEVEVGPHGEESLPVRVLASTDHWITANVRTSAGDAIRPLYRGPIPDGTEGVEVQWDGRDSSGEAVSSGRYELEIVSEDRDSQPVRKLVVGLSVESDAPPKPDVPEDTVATTVVPIPEPAQSGLWKGVAMAGAGLAGAAVIAAVPPAIHGLPESSARYAVAGSVGLAGIVGLVRTLRGRHPAEPVVEPDSMPGLKPGEGAAAEPTLLIRVTAQRRVELAGASSQRSGGTPPAGN